MCVWLKKLKVPSGFYSSIRSIVSMKDLTLTNYNSHDCHVILTTVDTVFGHVFEQLMELGSAGEKVMTVDKRIANGL